MSNTRESDWVARIPAHCSNSSTIRLDAFLSYRVETSTGVKCTNVMKEILYRMRALAAMAVVVVLVLVLGGVALVAGIIYPSRRIMAVCSVLWSESILLMAGVRLKIRGLKRVSDSTTRFFMGNHQSALDIPIMIVALRGQVRFMAKESLFRIPLFGWVIRRYGFVPVDRSNARRTLQTLDKMYATLRRHPVSIVVFPEGTRSRDGKLLPFRRGTMKVAQQVGYPVVPFSIDGSIKVLHPDRLLRVVPGQVTLTFGAPIAGEEVTALSAGELQLRTARAVAEQLGQPLPERDTGRNADEGDGGNAIGSSNPGEATAEMTNAGM